MNPENLKVLAERASTVEGRPTERLDEVHARIAHTRRRRQVGVVTAAVVAVVLALTAGAGVLALTDTDQTPPAKPAPIPTPKPPGEEKPVARKVTYATGQTIHWGDRTIDVGGAVAGVGATDDGVVYVRDENGARANCNGPQSCFNDLWFTDGSEVVRIGRVSGSWVRGYQVELSSAGSTVVWFEPDPDARPLNDYYGVGGEYVAYDTSERREVGRFGAGKSDLQWVYEDHVYWIPADKTWCLDFSKYYGECRRYKGIMRLDTATGVQTEVSVAAYQTDRNRRPRTFVVPIRGVANTPGPVYENGIGFGRDGDRLVASDGGGGDVTATLASTGESVRLRLPAGYHDDVELFFFEMWLDDDRFVISADNRGDILNCHLSSGRCRLAVKGPTTPAGEPTTTFGGHG